MIFYSYDTFFKALDTLKEKSKSNTLSIEVCALDDNGLKHTYRKNCVVYSFATDFTYIDIYDEVYSPIGLSILKSESNYQMYSVRPYYWEIISGDYKLVWAYATGKEITLRHNDETIEIFMDKTFDQLAGEGPKEDVVNRPSHYTNGAIECIDAMVKIFGKEKVAAFCQLNAFKYCWRAGKKSDNPADQDLKKADWYMNKFNELTKEA